MHYIENFDIVQTLDGDRILDSDCLAPYSDGLLCSHLSYLQNYITSCSVSIQTCLQQVNNVATYKIDGTQSLMVHIHYDIHANM